MKFKKKVLKDFNVEEFINSLKDIKIGINNINKIAETNPEIPISINNIQEMFK
jgi:hypothetical protein